MTPPFLLFMPSYNQAHYVEQAVQSILAQDDPNWELWIVDNSSDSTPEVMKRFADPRIRFHHIPARMDPGSCLNWMLERAVGRDFSYVHTDNNLGASYVRCMRAALAERPMGLAYCDMRTIDAQGRYINVYRRGKFDLPRLLSADSLGVPFASTMELARKVGGFSVRDFADDVRFCVGAYGLAEYVYVPQPLLDYRLHGDSRTEEAGGGDRMQRLFADMMPKIAPGLEQRGVNPITALANAIRQDLNDLDLLIEDTWHRKLSRWFAPWWQGLPRFDDFFFAGLIAAPGFDSSTGNPPLNADSPRAIRRVPLWAALALKAYFATRKRDVRRLSRQVRNKLVTWAAMTLGAPVREQERIRVRSADFRTLWVARQLQLVLGWTPLIDAAMADAPRWLRWERAKGDEPLLDCADEIILRK
jgi:glycosyltransferase involved in cell wall biosynthesis